MTRGHTLELCNITYKLLLSLESAGKSKCGFLTEFPQSSNDCTPQTLKVKLVLLSEGVHDGDILYRTSCALRLDSYLSPGS